MNSQVRLSVENYHKCATVANGRLGVQLRSSPNLHPESAKSLICEATREFSETCSQSFAACYDFREMVSSVHFFKFWLLDFLSSRHFSDLHLCCRKRPVLWMIEILQLLGFGFLKFKKHEKCHLEKCRCTSMTILVI